MGPDTRTRLILAAMELFWEKGYASTSMADVLRKADVQRRQPLSLFPRQAGPAAGRARFLQRRHPGELLKPAWEGRRGSPRARLGAARRSIAPTSSDGLLLRLPDRQPRARDPRARSARARKASPRTSRTGPSAVQQCLAAGDVAGRGGYAAARGVRAHDHGRRRDADPHLSRRRLLRPCDRRAARLRRRCVLQKEAARSDHTQRQTKGDITCRASIIWAVVAAAVAAFLIGGLWYSPVLFARSWQREVGLSDETLKNGNMAKIFGLGFVLALIAAFVFAMFLGPKPALSLGIGAGFAAGLAWVSAGPGHPVPVRKAVPEALFDQCGLPDAGLHGHRHGTGPLALTVAPAAARNWLTLQGPLPRIAGLCRSGTYTCRARKQRHRSTGPPASGRPGLSRNAQIVT